MTVTRSWGMARETFFRLFCLAPSIRSQRGCAIRSVLLRWKVYLSMHHPGNRTGEVRDPTRHPDRLTGRERACRLHIVMRTIPKNSDAALRARGLRLTGPRRAVLEALRASDAHPTAQSVHRLVRRPPPRLPLGTGDRNLRRLRAEGVAAEIPGPPAPSD